MTSVKKTTMNTKTLKSLVFFFNAFFFVFGWILLAVGSWSLYEFGAYKSLSESVPYTASSTLVITAGVLNGVASFFGLWAFSKDSRRLYAIFFLVLVVIFGLESSAAASGYHHREKVRHTLQDDMFHVIHKLYKVKTAPTIALDALQEQESCCGSYNYTDWRASLFANGSASVIPDSCCKEPQPHCGENFSLQHSDLFHILGCYEDLLHGIIRDKLYFVTAIAAPAALFKGVGALTVLLLIVKIGQTNEVVPLSVPLT